jgi:hypothetical protein
MGQLEGFRQITMYVDPDVYDQAAYVARMLGVPIYMLINKALEQAIINNTTPSQRKALGRLTTKGPPIGGGTTVTGKKRTG